eukprot:jgi/Mesvir1/22800/Mv14184-RA.1
MAGTMPRRLNLARPRELGSALPEMPKDTPHESQKNRVAVASGGGSEYLTRVPAGATQVLMRCTLQRANYALHALADEMVHCPTFAAAGDFPAVMRCIIAGASAPEGADASYVVAHHLSSVLNTHEPMHLTRMVEAITVATQSEGEPGHKLCPCWPLMVKMLHIVKAEGYDLVQHDPCLAPYKQ